MNIVDYTNQFILPSSNNDLPENQVAKNLEFENIIMCEGDLGIKKIQKSINEYQSKHLKFLKMILLMQKTKFQMNSNHQY